LNSGVRPPPEWPSRIVWRDKNPLQSAMRVSAARAVRLIARLAQKADPYNAWQNKHPVGITPLP